MISEMSETINHISVTVDAYKLNNFVKKTTKAQLLSVESGNIYFPPGKKVRSNFANDFFLKSQLCW